MDTKKVTLEVPVDVYRDIEAVAVEDERSRSKVMIRLMRDALARRFEIQPKLKPSPILKRPYDPRLTAKGEFDE